MYTYFEGVNGVKWLATKGYKILLTTRPTKRGKNYRLATKKLTVIYRKPIKVEPENRQSNEILTDNRPPPPPFQTLCLVLA